MVGTFGAVLSGYRNTVLDALTSRDALCNAVNGKAPAVNGEAAPVRYVGTVLNCFSLAQSCVESKHCTLLVPFLCIVSLKL